MAAAGAGAGAALGAGAEAPHPPAGGWSRRGQALGAAGALAPGALALGADAPVPLGAYAPVLEAAGPAALGAMGVPRPRPRPRQKPPARAVSGSDGRCLERGGDWGWGGPGSGGRRCVGRCAGVHDKPLCTESTAPIVYTSQIQISKSASTSHASTSQMTLKHLHLKRC